MEQFAVMEEAPQTDAPFSDAPTPMEVENEGEAVAQVEDSNPSQEGQEVRNIFLHKCFILFRSHSNFTIYLLKI